MQLNKKRDGYKSYLRAGVFSFIFLTVMASVSFGAYNLYVYPDPSNGSHGSVTNPVTVASDADALANLPYVGGFLPVSISATGAGGYVFSRWSFVLQPAGATIGDTNASSTSVSYVGTNDVYIKADFELPTLNVSIVGSGSITKTPDQATYTSGAVVGLLASPSAGYAFDGWTGDLISSSASTNVTMDSSKDITANFSQLADVDLVVISKDDSGTTVGNPQVNGVPVPSPSAHAHEYNSEIEIMVDDIMERDGNQGIRVLHDGYTRDFGSGPSNGPNTSVGFRITTNTQYTFNWRTQYLLTFEVVGDGNIQPTPDGDVDEKNRGVWYDSGTVVSLTAINGQDTFQKWGGAASGVIPATSVTITNAMIVYATFAQDELDSDGDGMSDLWEQKYGLKYDGTNAAELAYAASGIHGPDGDPDNDGLPNLLEYNITQQVKDEFPLGSIPIDADSDGDGMNDFYEYNYIKNPSFDYEVGDQRNIMAVVSANGVYGRTGNLDQDFHWQTTTGYESDNGLINIEEYIGSDGIDPCILTATIVGDITNVVIRMEVNPADTGDMTYSDTTDSESAGGEITGDGFDDGFEYSWDQYQDIHGGDPVRDPLGHTIPYRSGIDALPLSAATADFDGDTNLDVVVVNSGLNQAAVFYGQGNGILAAPEQNLDVGSVPSCIIAADLEKDGSTNDLIIANSGGSSLSIIICNNDGTFASAVTVGVGTNPSRLVTGDFNQDGNLDIAVANTGGDSVTILNGGGGSVFSEPGFSPVALPAGAAPSDVDAGPIWGAVTNAVIDLAVAGYGRDEWYILQNDGTGVFALSVTNVSGVQPSCIKIGDFGGGSRGRDGTNDVTISTYGDSSIRSYFGDGAGGFVSPAAEAVFLLGDGRGPVHFGVDDFNTGDDDAGHLDLAVANQLYYPGTVRILEGAASASFSGVDTFVLGKAPSWVQVADITGDGTNDLVIVERDGGTISTWRGFGADTAEFSLMSQYDTTKFTQDRRFHPGLKHVDPPDFGRRDYDLVYDPETGAVGAWLTDDLEYNAWQNTISPLLRGEFPDRRRCTNPFLWDTDGDKMPDGWEMAFGYNPWNKGDEADANPDGDAHAVSGELKNSQVYDEVGYNPYTAWGYGGNHPNSEPFSNYEELIGDRGFPALIPFDPGDSSTHPLKSDTDGDGMPDGWELYVKQNPRSSDDKDFDVDGDGLSNMEEFESSATPPKFGRPHNGTWPNKKLPTDPNDPDTDRDQISDGAEKAAFNYILVQYLSPEEEGTNVVDDADGSTNVVDDADGSTNDVEESPFVPVNFRSLGGGLNPTSADTDRDHLPDEWELKYAGVIGADGVVVGGMDGTRDDSKEDADGDGLKNYQEYMCGAVYMWQFQYNNGDVAWIPGMDLNSYEPYDFFDETLSNGGESGSGPGGRSPYEWDPVFKIGDKDFLFPWAFITAAEKDTGLWFSTTDPTLKDTDHDGMDDYWEVYHGMNPLFGFIDVVRTKVSGLLTYAHNLDEEDFIILSDDIDVRRYPWLSGSIDFDLDEDGFANIFESIQPNVLSGPPYYHTDPTPLWMTDTSYRKSWVNLFYWLGNTFGNPTDSWWYWDQIVMERKDYPPSYLFSFEMNEGFDTDNDNLSDRVELRDTSISPGVTDGLESQSPTKRRALYLNGDAAARTLSSFGHYITDFRTFTVELWVRPQNPASGQEQILVERPLSYNGAILLNFCMGLDSEGHLFASYDGDSPEFLSEKTTATSEAVLEADEWVHVAASYDGDFIVAGNWSGILKLYINGDLVGAAPSSEIPFNGWIGSLVEGTNSGMYVSGPIVVGSGDDNPGGWPHNSPIYVGPYTGDRHSSPVLVNFFKGWVDQVNIWNKSRTQEEIRDNMFKRYTRDEIYNFVNDLQNPTNSLLSHSTNSSLRYSFSFDDLPDPDYDPVAPDGFDLLGNRPLGYISIAWWGNANDRSYVYNDYRYIPWIDNLTGHGAPLSPLDSSEIWSTSNVFPNTSNPYSLAYKHATRARYEHHPDIDPPSTGNNDGTSNTGGFYPDLLPLHWAVADEDVVMWDNNTSSTGRDSYDTDGDGMPDDWEDAHGLDPRDATGDQGADGDADGDGLSNYDEYLSGTNPNMPDTDNDNVLDYDEDPDGDNLSTRTEIETYRTDPFDHDTDDDGVNDDKENSNVTDPKDSLSPYMSRALRFGGGTDSVVRVAYNENLPDKSRFDLTTWTLEMIVQPEVADQTAVLLQKQVEKGGLRNFEVGLTNGIPYVLYDSAAGSLPVMVVGSEKIPVGLDVHTSIGARCITPRDGNVGSLKLYVNGEKVAEAVTRSVCEVGAGDLLLGSPEYIGTLREVRIWKTARPENDIIDFHDRTLFFGSGVSDAGILHVNGAGLLKESATTIFEDEYIDHLTNEWTLEAWVRTTDTDGGTIIARRNQGNPTVQDFNYYLGMESDGTLRGWFAINYWRVRDDTNTSEYIEFQNFTANVAVGEKSINDGEWHHVAYVRDSESCRLYIDGVSDGIKNRLMVPGDDPAGIVAVYVRAQDGPVVVGEGLVGDIDECRIWNVGLDIGTLKDVSSRNISGSNHGLVSYFSFDYQQSDLADERAYARDPENEYGVYIGDAERVIDDIKIPPINLMPMRVYSGIALVGYFAAVDGGITIEDYTHQMGRRPFDYDLYAGVFGSTNISFYTILNDADDSDDDGMPDWWESRYNINPGISAGDDGAFADPDHDGLINLYEYLAWADYGAALDPLNYKTFDTNVVNDSLFMPASGGGLTIGELLEDTDVLPDGWEVMYPKAMDRHNYNRDQDPDHDEWNNQEEYLAGTDPTNPTSAPIYSVSGVIQYNGMISGAVDAFSVLAYNSADMDTVPIKGTVSLAGGVLEYSFTNIASRSIWLLAYKSESGGENAGAAGFTAGDAYGIVGPISASLDGVTDVVIPVLDQVEMPWFGAFSWPMPSSIPSVYVRMKDSDGRLILTRWIHADRNTFHAVDYKRGISTTAADYSFGLPPGNYSWQVASNDISNLKYQISKGWLNVPTYTPLPTPEIVSPLGVDVIVHQLHDFVWRSDPQLPMPLFQIEISSVAGGWTYTMNADVQASDLNGTRVLRMPLQSGGIDLFGSGSWVPGEYSWRVRAGNNSIFGNWSASRRFQIANMNAPPQSSGAPQIFGNVLYHGKAISDRIVVRAFNSSGSGSRVEGQVTMSSATPFDLDFTLGGLRHVTYTLMAFIDLNHDGICDEWEPQGIARDNVFGAYYQYRADAYALGKFSLEGADSIYDVSILIRDRDTDNDNVMDGWEWENMHNSPKGMTYGGEDDMDEDGLSNLEEYGLNSDPTDSDSDDDGLSDGDEINLYGTSPTNNDSDGDTLDDGYEVNDLGLSPSSADDDGDGVPTSIEVSWGNIVGGAIGADDMDPRLSDTDGDGVVDLMEIASGSDPVNGADTAFIAIGSVTRPLNSISWNVGSNKRSVDVTYIIEYSFDMVSWTAVGELTDDGDNSKTLMYGGITLPAEGGFYRLRLEIR